MTCALDRTMHALLQAAEADLIRLDNIPVSKAGATLAAEMAAARDAVRIGFKAMRAGHPDGPSLAALARTRAAEAVRAARISGLM